MKPSSYNGVLRFASIDIDPLYDERLTTNSLLATKSSKSSQASGPDHRPCTRTTGGRTTRILSNCVSPVSRDAMFIPTNRSRAFMSTSALAPTLTKSTGALYAANAIGPLAVSTATSESSGVIVSVNTLPGGLLDVEGGLCGSKRNPYALTQSASLRPVQ